MSGMIDIGVTGLNSIGRGFCTYATGVFVQTAVLVATLFVLDILLRKHVRATLRYWIWMLVFVKLLLPPSLSVPTGIGYWYGKYAPPAPSAAPQPAETAASAPVRREPTARVEPPAGPRPAAQAIPAIAEPAEPVAARGERLFWQGRVFALWIAGVMVFSVLLVKRLVFVSGLIARGEPAGGDLLDLLDRCRRRVGVRRKVGLLLSPNAFSPAVCGFFRPVILMPQKLFERLPAYSVEAILIHELAHLKRGDIWVNCVQTVLQIIYFYNPLVWLANAVVRRVREQAVDEMALVALGAEAGSYSRTLIDIAEMAFLRPGPALGLIGVAESRKSLEGRIKHMMTRPVPRHARVGVVGLISVAVVAAVVLPMGAAPREMENVLETEGSRFAMSLSRGGSVELVAVCNWPERGATCWKPDGAKLEERLRISKWNQSPGADDYGFILRVSNLSDVGLSMSRIAGADGWESSCEVSDGQGHRLEDYTATIARIEDARSETTVRVGIAAGPWSTVAMHEEGQMDIDREGGVLWSPAFDTGSGVSIVASRQCDHDVQQRVVAVDESGVVHTTYHGSISSGNVYQLTAQFRDLTRDRVAHFEYQVRPFEWIEFRSVSLRPGVKMEPRMQGKVSGLLDTGSDSLANLFVMGSSQGAGDVFGAAIARAGEWTWNKTGRDHAKKSYDEIFNGTHNRTDHDVLILLFALDRQDRIPAEYEDLLPRPWVQIKEHLQQGRVVELSGQARGLHVILLAAPKAAQLTQVIAGSQLLGDPRALLGSSGQGSDAAVEDFKAITDPDRGTFSVVASIRNVGSAATPKFIVAFYQGDPATTRAMIHGAGPIEPEDTWNEASRDFGLTDGAKEIHVVLDPANLVEELDETNNRATLRVVVKDGQIAEQSLVRTRE